MRTGRPPKTKLEVEKRAREALAARGFVRRAELLEGLAESSVDAVVKSLVAESRLSVRLVDGVPLSGVYVAGTAPL